jgi:hypothetical protein
MDDVEADERREGQGNRDGGGVNVEGQLAGGGFHGELLCLVVKGEDWAQMHETHAAKSCAWVFELAAKFEVFAYSRQTPAQQRGMRQHMQQKAAVVWICFI